MSCRRELISQIIDAQYQTSPYTSFAPRSSHSHCISKNCTVVPHHSFIRRHTRVYPTLYNHSVKWSPFLQTASRLSGPEEIIEVECQCSNCTNGQIPSKDAENYGSPKENKSTLDNIVTTTLGRPSFSRFTQRYSEEIIEESDAKFDTRLRPDKDLDNPLTFANDFDVLYAHKQTTTRDRITKCHRDMMTQGFEISDAACGPGAEVWSTKNRSSRTSRASRATGQAIRAARRILCRTATPSQPSSRASSETPTSSRTSSRDRADRRRRRNGYDRKQDNHPGKHLGIYPEYQDTSDKRPRHCIRWYEPERDPGPGSATRTNCSPGVECTKEYAPLTSALRSFKRHCTRVRPSRPTQPEDTHDSSAIPETGRRILYNEGISDDVLKKWPNFKEHVREVTPRRWVHDEPRHRSESRVQKTQGCGPPCGETYIPFSQFNPSKYHVECKRENRHYKADTYRPPSPTSYLPSTPDHCSLPRPSCRSLTRLTPAPRKVLTSKQDIECFVSMLGNKRNWSADSNHRTVIWKCD